MSRTVSRVDIRTRVMKLANVENDPSFDVTGINALINLHFPVVYDLLVNAGPADYYAASADYAVSASTIVYPLPDDFMALVTGGVLVQESSDYLRPIDPMQDRERQLYRAPVADCAVTMEYIPTCPVLDDDADTFDGVDGWDELVSALSARDILVQREGDTSVVMAIASMSEKRIRSFSGQRTKGGPTYTVDVELDIGWPRSVQLDAYRLRGGNIEFYTSLWGPYA